MLLNRFERARDGEGQTVLIVEKQELARLVAL